MQYDGIIATFGEIFLKGKNRNRFIDTILRIVKRQLEEFDTIRIRRTHANLNVELNGTDPDPIIAKLSKVFGINGFSSTPIVRVT